MTYDHLYLFQYWFRVTGPDHRGRLDRVLRRRWPCSWSGGVLVDFQETADRYSALDFVRIPAPRQAHRAWLKPANLAGTYRAAVLVVA